MNIDTTLNLIYLEACELQESDKLDRGLKIESPRGIREGQIFEYFIENGDNKRTILTAICTKREDDFIKINFLAEDIFEKSSDRHNLPINVKHHNQNSVFRSIPEPSRFRRYPGYQPYQPRIYKDRR